MAEAGYPDGRGFPRTEMWLRVADTGINRIAGEAVQAMLKETLGIELVIRYQQRNIFNENLFQWQIPMGMLVFVYDYPDPFQHARTPLAISAQGICPSRLVARGIRRPARPGQYTHGRRSTLRPVRPRGTHPGGGGGRRFSLPSGNHRAEKTLSPGDQTGPGRPRGADHIRFRPSTSRKCTSPAIESLRDAWNQQTF